MMYRIPPYIILNMLRFPHDILDFHIYQTGNFMENKNSWNTRDQIWVFLHRKQASLPTYLAVLTHVHLWKQTSHV